MSNYSFYRLDWVAGPSAQLEFFDPADANNQLYKLKYTPALRATLRPPIEDLTLGAPELQPINALIDGLARTLNAREAAASQPAPPQPSAVAGAQLPSLETQLCELGGMLCTCVIPPYVQTDLGVASLFLELGMNERLLGYPWELMHDGNEFLCLKHHVGRFVNLAAGRPPPLARAQAGVPFSPLKVLLIVVDRPMPRDGINYPPLRGAFAEADSVFKTLGKIPDLDVKLLSGSAATFNDVYHSLCDDKPHIVHYCGHASFNENQPRQSSLILHDRDMTTGLVYTFVSRASPILCFINGCETAKAVGEGERFNVYGLARSFLETGSYLLGSRWKVNDDAATTFAGQFYTSLLTDGKSLGQSVKEARLECKRVAPDDFAWASYVLYGDPRLYFRRSLA